MIMNMNKYNKRLFLKTLIVLTLYLLGKIQWAATLRLRKGNGCDNKLILAHTNYAVTVFFLRFHSQAIQQLFSKQNNHLTLNSIRNIESIPSSELQNAFDENNNFQICKLRRLT